MAVLARLVTGQLTMAELTGFVSDGTLARVLAMLFLFLFMVGTAGVAGYEIVMNEPINPYVLTLLGAGLSTALTLLGVHLGKTAGLPPSP